MQRVLILDDSNNTARIYNVLEDTTDLNEGAWWFGSVGEETKTGDENLTLDDVFGSEDLYTPPNDDEGFAPLFFDESPVFEGPDADDYTCTYCESCSVLECPGNPNR